MKRPKLNEIDLKEILNTPQALITMSEGQWDLLLQKAYNTGCILVEINELEIPVKAYRLNFTKH